MNEARDGKRSGTAKMTALAAVCGFLLLLYIGPCDDEQGLGHGGTQSPGLAAVQLDSYSLPLKALIPGIPGTSAVREERGAFTPKEKMAVQGEWDPSPEGFVATFRWLGPEGEERYKKDMPIEKGWRRTLVRYRGALPMSDGKWVVVVDDKGRQLGATGFLVTRSVSDIPLKRHLLAFESNKITRADATTLLALLHEHLDEQGTPDSIAAKLPSELAGRKVAVAVSLFAAGHPTASALGAGDTLRDSLVEVLQTLKPAAQQPDAIELSVVHQSLELRPLPSVVSKKLERNAGFSLSGLGKQGLLLPATISRLNLRGGEDLLRQLCKEAGLPEDSWQNREVQLTTFQTQDFVEIASDGKVRMFAFAREVVDPAEVEYPRLRQTVKSATDWFVRNQHDDGRYLYSYVPAIERAPDDDWCLRGLNAVFVLSEIAMDTKDEELLASVEKAAKIYLDAMSESDGKYYLHWEKHRPCPSVAAPAFILATYSALGDKDKLPVLERIAESLYTMQAADGSIKSRFVGESGAMDQLFYPGEMLLGLMRYHGLTKDTRAIEVVEAAFPYYVKFWKGKKEAPYVPWQVRAFSELFYVTNNEKYRDYCFELQDWLLKRYPPLGADEMLGRRGALATQLASSGVYAEGLAAAYDLAVRVGDRKRVKRYGVALKGLMGYLMGLQYSEHDVFWLSDRGKVIGALATKPYDSEIRLDFTYHAISAMHAFSSMLDEQEWDSMQLY
jgi:hypothetical protein